MAIGQCFICEVESKLVAFWPLLADYWEELKTECQPTEIGLFVGSFNDDSRTYADRRCKRLNKCKNKVVSGSFQNLRTMFDRFDTARGSRSYAHPIQLEGTPTQIWKGKSF